MPKSSLGVKGPVYISYSKQENILFTSILMLRTKEKKHTITLLFMSHSTLFLNMPNLFSISVELFVNKTKFVRRVVVLSVAVAQLSFLCFIRLSLFSACV